MDKIKLLRQRRDALKDAGKNVRGEIASLTDENSFVELSVFSFSKDAFYGEDAQGEGIVTGFATVGGFPFYIVAQNFEVSFGGLSKAGCEKICKTLALAERNCTPVIYLLNSYGVRVGEGTEVLEGISNLLLSSSRLKGTVMQFAYLCGEVYGSTAALAANCDCIFFTEKASLCLSSPLVLSAKAGKNLKSAEVGGYNALTNALLPAVSVRDTNDVQTKIKAIYALISAPMTEANLNAPVPALNKKADAAEIIKVIEDGIELGANSCPQIKTILGRIGGISVAAVVFDDASVDCACVRKIRDFAQFASCYNLPFVTFVDCKGAEQTLSANNGLLLKEISEYLSMLDTIDTAKISVVTGKAIGLGYSLFAAKSAGFDYAVAFASAQISLFESAVGAEVEFSGEKRADKAKLQALYSEEVADPVNAAKGGYIDDIIEPQFVKQYVTASLQTLLR